MRGDQSSSNPWRRIANTSLPVLLCGESGVGKERFAAYIHNRSAHSDAPFITLDSCGFNETLFESELFGHEAGAFTDARQQKKGLFELAHGGTLFLDEIGEISPTIQSKLLRVLDTGNYRRVGGTKTLTANVRIISATNRNLLEMVEEGTFRRDLYYRLAGHTVSLPALRDRKSDIPALVCFFMQAIEKKVSPTADTMRLLKAYDYPGNIRELKHIVELAVLKGTDGFIYPEHLPALVLNPVPANNASELDVIGRAQEESTNPATNLLNDHGHRIEDRVVLGMETSLVLSALTECRGSRRSAARELGISERKMYRIIQRFQESGIPVPKPYQ
jgi:transcriptional regulator with PAS, ATPase and Fis domain